MSHLAGPENNQPGKDKVTTTGLKTRKLAGEKITALTAFDCLGASILEEAGVDLILVGDSLAHRVGGLTNGEQEGDVHRLAVPPRIELIAEQLLETGE